MLKRLLYSSALFSAVIASNASAAMSIEERISLLERELNTLKQEQKMLKIQAQKEKKEAVAAAVAAVEARYAKQEHAVHAIPKIQPSQPVVHQESKPAATSVELGSKGLKITSPDKDMSLGVRGFVQFDNRSFISDDNHEGIDTFLVRRARPTIESTIGDFYLRFTPDFGAEHTAIYDAYAEYRAYKALNFRVGKSKPAVSLERLKSVTDLTFAEASMPSNLTANRDAGVTVFGSPIPQLNYEFGIFNGVQEGGNNSVDDDDKKDVTARLFTHPFNQTDTALRGLGFGVGGSIGEHQGSVTERQLSDYRTPGQAKFFSYLSSSFADGEGWRISPQAYYYYGPLGILAEYVIASQEVSNGAVSDRFEHESSEIQLSYVLTGEDATYKSVIPKNPFDAASGQWGAWEVATRYGELRVDNDVFPVFADPDLAAQEARNWGIALNGYMNENIRLTFDYEYTTFDGGAAGGADRESEQVVITRLLYKF